MNSLSSIALLACLFIPQEAKKFKLVFEPKDGETRVVTLVHDEEWEYKDEDMKGKLRTELTLRWKFTIDAETKAVTAKASYDRVVYRGKGRKKGNEFKYDVEWTEKEGFLKGDAYSDEIKEGVTLKFDRRASCETGQC